MLNAVKIGNEFLLNTTTAGNQGEPAIASLPSGGFVAAWADWSATPPDTSQAAIRAQVFNASGVRIGAELVVNATTPDAQMAPTVGVLSDGRFVIGWQDASRGAGDGSGEAVRAQIFNPDGSKAGAELVVPAVTLNHQQQPVVAALPGGAFVFAWKDISNGSGDGEVSAIRAMIRNADGVSTSGEFLVNTATADGQERPAITALADGHFVVSWIDYSGIGGDASNAAIKAQVFDALGERVGSELLVNTTTAGPQLDPSVTHLSDGRFAIAWSDLSQSPDDSSGAAVRAQVFNADGTRFGGELLVNTAVGASQHQPDLTALPAGRFAVAWTDAGGTTATSSRIHAQVFNGDGSRLGGAFTVNTTDDQAQTRPVMTTLADGRFVIAWDDRSASGGDPSGSAVRAQIFDLRDGPVITLNGGGAAATVSVLENTQAVANVMATDTDSPALTWSIAGGADAALFRIDAATGELSFIAAPDFEAPADGGANNSYVVAVRVSDGMQGDEQIITVNVTDVAERPAITSNGGGDTAVVGVAENQAAVTNVAASDADAGVVLQFSIAGGADAARFQIDAATGALSFVAAPDYDVPADADHDNTYQVVVRASDGALRDEQAISVSIENMNEAPRIAGGSSATIPMPENGTAVGSITAVDPDEGTLLNFSITGGADASRFQIDAATGALSFIAAPDYEAPADAGHDNVYDVRVRVSDGALSDEQAVAVHVSDAPEVAKFGDEFLINTATAYEQFEPSVAAFSSGRLVAAWTDAGSTPHTQNIRVQVFEADGGKLGDELLVTSPMPGYRVEPSVATLAGGRFVVTWSGFDSPGTMNIHAQMFDRAGKIGGAILVNDASPASSKAPTVTELAGGQFVIAWTDPIGTIRAQVFEAGGAKAGAAIAVGPATLAAQERSAVTALADGRFVVSWMHGAADGAALDANVVARAFNPDGSAASHEFRINAATDHDALYPAIASLAGGRFVATWVDRTAAGDGQDFSVIRARIFRFDGSPSSAEFTVDTAPPGVQSDPAVTGLPDGRFILTWRHASPAGGDGSGSAIRGQLFDSDGSKLGDAFLVNSTTLADQSEPSVATLADGRVVVGWTDLSQSGGDTSYHAVRGQILDPRLAPVDLSGTADDDDLIGTRLDDTMRQSSGNDRLDGAAGNDTAVFTQDRDQYLVQALGAGRFKILGFDGLDELVAFERFQFADVTLEADELAGDLHAPQITSHGGGSTAALAIAENAELALLLAATDPDVFDTLHWSIAGGADAARFWVDPDTGELLLGIAPDFEAPADADQDNSYHVVVRVSDGVLFDEQAITVTVSDVPEQDAPVARLGDEILVNTTTASDQSQPALAALYTGRLVAAWTDQGGSTEGIRLQLFGAAGNKLGAELAIDAAPGAHQSRPEVAALYDGRIVVTWSDGHVRAQVFDPDGSKASPAFVVSDAGNAEATVTQLSDGRFAVAWADRIAGGHVGAQIFNADATASGEAFRVDTIDTLAVFHPSIVPLAAGRFLVSWANVHDGGTTMRARIFRPDGAPLADEFVLSPGAAGTRPAVASLPDGGFVAAWQDGSRTGGDVDGTAIRARIFRFDGSTSGAELVVNTTTALDQLTPDVATLADGRFVVVWADLSASGGDTSQAAVRAQLFNADGSRSGTELLVNTTTLHAQHDPKVAALADGRFMVAWTDASQSGGDTDGDAIRAQIFDPRIAAVQLVGTMYDDELIGTPFDDSMFGGGGNDRFDAGAGDDLMIFGSVREKYMLHVRADGLVEVTSSEGHSVLADFEHFQFLNMTVGTEELEATNPHVPQIVSDGGGDTAVLSVDEGTVAVTTVSATDPDLYTMLRYSISGGSDRGLFAINAVTGALTFVAPPDFETPRDADHDNAYVVEVRASDGNHADTQTLTVRVRGPDGQPDLIWLTGTPDDDIFTALPGNERIDALGGADTVLFDFKLTEAAVSYAGNQVIIDSAHGHTVLTGFERYAFADGTVDNRDANALVDDLFYYSRHHDVWNAGVDADQHYAEFGWREARDPSAFFSTSLYRALSPEVAAAGVNPLTHYDQSGWQEGRVPSIAFDAAAYLEANPDVAQAQVDPLLHYLMFGAQEGRQPFAFGELLTHNGFDYVYYLQQNPDVAAAHVDPFAHFTQYGWKEGRDPNALFDTSGYLAAYADIAAAGVNPLDHYAQSGWQEGRDPSLAFDTTQYIEQYADVAAARVNPLLHALQFGIHEGRVWLADGAWG